MGSVGGDCLMTLACLPGAGSRDREGATVVCWAMLACLLSPEIVAQLARYPLDVFLPLHHLPPPLPLCSLAMRLAALSVLSVDDLEGSGLDPRGFLEELRAAMQQVQILAATG